jgi:sugar transport protein
MTGLGPVFWLLIAELFPLDARVVGFSFRPLASAIGQGETFWVFAAVCALSFVFAARYVPETKGRGFSEIGAELRARWGREQGQEAPAY